MKQLFLRRVAIFLLATYVPLSLSLGFLHADEDQVHGSGRVEVHVPSSGASARAVETGPCIACLIISGHHVQHNAILPETLAARFFFLEQTPAPASLTPESPSARAPPVSHSS